MTTSNESEAKQPLKLSRPGKLQLKKTVETGQVRQSFSHGRSKAVTVEVKRSRTFERGSSGRMTEVTEAAAEAEAALGETPASSDERRVGNECGRRGRCRWLPSDKKKKKLHKQKNPIIKKL